MWSFIFEGDDMIKVYSLKYNLRIFNFDISYYFKKY